METTPLWIRFALTLGLMGALLAFSIIPGNGRDGGSVIVWAVTMTPPLVQKLAHGVLYATLAFLWAWTLEAVGSFSLRLLLALALAAGFGAAMEFAQTHVTGRFGTLYDVLLNSSAALVGLAFAMIIL